jgi:hypothetical protein
VVAKEGLSMKKRTARKAPSLVGHKIDQALAPLIAALVGPDEGRRRAVALHALCHGTRPTLGRIAERLVQALLGPDERARRQARASLVDFGSLSAPALLAALRRPGKPGVQVALIDALQTVALALDADQRALLLLDLDILAHGTGEEAVRKALLGAVMSLRS